MEDREFMNYLNMCSIYEIESMCDQFGSAIVLEDGRITNYIIERKQTNE